MYIEAMHICNENTRNDQTSQRKCKHKQCTSYPCVSKACASKVCVGNGVVTQVLACGIGCVALARLDVLEWLVAEGFLLLSALACPIVHVAG